jgi:hypothetical protein
MATRITLITLPVGLYLFLLSLIPVPTDLLVTDFITTTLARLIVVGTFVLGVLSGLGAMNNAWMFLPISRHDRS